MDKGIPGPIASILKLINVRRDPRDWSEAPEAFSKMKRSPQEEMLLQFAAWRDSLLGSHVRSHVATRVLHRFSLCNYFLALDSTTQLAIIVSLAVCGYIFFSSVLRVGRMLFSLAALLLLLFLAVIAVLIALEYRDVVLSALQLVTEKLDL